MIIGFLSESYETMNISLSVLRTELRTDTTLVSKTARLAVSFGFQSFC